MNRTIETLGNATGQTGWRKTYASKWTPPAQPCGHWGKHDRQGQPLDLRQGEQHQNIEGPPQPNGGHRIPGLFGGVWRGC